MQFKRATLGSEEAPKLGRIRVWSADTCVCFRHSGIVTTKNTG